jgi:ABC-2 type transport system permease protein
MKRYLAFTRGSFMVGLVYRFGPLFSLVGNFIYLGVAYYLWKSIYKNSETLRDMTFHETFLYVAIGSAVFILLKTYVDWEVSYEIREGIISTHLTKPLDYQTFILFTSLGQILMSLLVITLPTILIITLVFKVSIPLGLGTLLFPLSLLLAFVISFCFDYFTGVMAFYTESVWGLSTVKEIIILGLSGALIPLQFFPQKMQGILLALPFQTIYHTPLMMLTKPDQPLSTFLPMLAIQIVWAVVLFVLTRLFFEQAVKVLRIAGG